MLVWFLPRNGSREKRDDVEQIWDLTSHHMGDTIEPSSETWQMFLKRGGGEGEGEEGGGRWVRNKQELVRR